MHSSGVCEEGNDEEIIEEGQQASMKEILLWFGYEGSPKPIQGTILSYPQYHREHNIM